MNKQVVNSLNAQPDTGRTGHVAAGKRRTLRFVSILFIEILVTMLLVLVSYVAFLLVLQIVFPAGSTGGLIGEKHSPDESAGLAQRVMRSLFLLDGEQESSWGKAVDLAAVLAQSYKTVKSKSADTIVWKSTKLGMPLYDHDAVQTFEKSSATIAFDETNQIEMGENTLVVIKRMGQDRSLPDKRSFFVVVDGELRGKIMGAGANSVDLQVTLPGAVAQIQSPQKNAGASDFKIKVKPDKSAVITVYTGSAKIASAGGTHQVGEHQGITIGPDGAFRPAGPLPDAPVPTAPSQDRGFVYGGLPPRIEFSWLALSKVSRYRFQLASDPEFRQRIVDETVTKPGFAGNALSSGDYYWKVSALSGDFESSYSATWHFQVRQALEPPALTVKFPPGVMYRSDYILRGTTEPGAEVFVNGINVNPAADGTFSYQGTLKQGINAIVVKAVADVYNEAYRSQIVYGKF